MGPPTDCLDPHCYGTVWWWGGNIGAETAILIKAIRYDELDRHSISNALWVADNDNSTCLGNRCWVEVGYTSGYLMDLDAYVERAYYTADVRPHSIYFEHFLGHVQAVDLNAQADFRIERKEGTTDVFKVTIFPPSAPLYAESTSNAMAPDLIEIGQEIYGYWQRVLAPKQIWSYNSWIDSNHVLHYQTANGNPYQDYPPIRAYWQLPPQFSPNGGEWYVECCHSP